MARTILVVDDEPTLRETVVDALEADGFRVIAAADGREALTRFRADQPDLILLDLMLPELSGVEVCRIIRAESGVPIVMLTAKDSELDKVVGLELGADDYVTKPFSLRELSARIRAIFRRSEQAAVTEQPPANVEIGDVQVDLGGHRLLRDGVPLPVKPKAFELLSFLLRHPGQVFTRDQLLERVWGYDYAGETRTVDVHIHWLRSQLEDRPVRAAVHPHGPRRRSVGRRRTLLCAPGIVNAARRLSRTSRPRIQRSAPLVEHPLDNLSGVLGRVDRFLEPLVDVPPFDDLERFDTVTEQPTDRSAR